MGDDRFMERVQEMTGRNLRKGRPGRAAKSGESQEGIRYCVPEEEQKGHLAFEV